MYSVSGYNVTGIVQHGTRFIFNPGNSPSLKEFLFTLKLGNSSKNVKELAQGHTATKFQLGSSGAQMNLDTMYQGSMFLFNDQNPPGFSSMLPLQFSVFTQSP